MLMLDMILYAGRKVVSIEWPKTMASIQTKTFTAKNGQQFTIRTAKPQDAVAMLAYIRSLAEESDFLAIQPDEMPGTEDEERKWVQDHLDHPGKIVLVAETDRAIIGNVSFENGPYRRIAHRGHLGIAVAKEWRGRGVGTKLLETLLDWATANPVVEKMCLQVFVTNTIAIQLYKSLGFVEEGRQSKDIKLGPGQYVDRLLMGRFVK
jgi:RimJ/RimL family protein N-acetyltransferase